MASIIKKKLKSGEISYKIQVKVKDPLKDKWVTVSKTWKKPPSMTEYQAKKELQRISFEFDEEVNRKKQGILADDKDMHFDDYAREFTERQKKIYGVSHYLRDLSSLKKSIAYFGHIKLKDITPRFVQKYIDSLSDSKIETISVKLKENTSLRLIAKNKGIRIKSLKCFGAYESLHRGENVTMESAEKICEELQIKLEDYFDIIKKSRPYAKSTISKHKKFVHQVLKRAKREGLIEHNFASSDYIEPIKGEKKEIVSLNDKEAKIFKQALDEEKNIRWKTAMYIFLFMGIRRAELCGLEWKDIDFKAKTMSINRSCYDVSGQGLVTKDPKTFTSRRTLTIPENLLKILKEYKDWYDERRLLLKDIWEDTDRLIVNDDGRPIYPSTYISWLRKILKRAGLKEVTLHSLRHTNITLQLVSGVDLRTVSARAGHARTSTTTDIYSHFIKNSDIHACKIIDTIFDSETEIDFDLDNKN